MTTSRDSSEFENGIGELLVGTPSETGQPDEGMRAGPVQAEQIPTHEIDRSVGQIVWPVTPRQPCAPRFPRSAAASIERRTKHEHDGAKHHVRDPQARLWQEQVTGEITFLLRR